MYVIIWEYWAGTGRQEEFERVYGPEGEWTQLFARAAGYFGTELLRDLEERGRYVTIDRWASRTAFEAFRSRWNSEYLALDRRCETLTERETALGTFARPGP